MTFTLVIKLLWAFIFSIKKVAEPSGYKGQGKGHKFSGVLECNWRRRGGNGHSQTLGVYLTFT